MSRDSNGFRSWFQRAMLLSPSITPSSYIKTENDNEDDDEDSVDNERSALSTDWLISKDGLPASTTINPESSSKGKTPNADGSGRSRRAEVYSEWCLLQEDNVRLWDCLAMLRTDSSMTSHTAIHIVTQAPNTDYFPKDVRSGYKNFFKDENQLVVEVLRLTVENQKLHAVLWVLADNPVIRVDSVLAAVFRLSDEQFREKFKFEYRPGCFSDKGMVMGSSGRDDKSTTMLHGKRCRSSTPIRSFKPARNLSERISQSVSRRGNTRTGGQNNSSNRRCRMEKLEPPRKHPDIWMMSALLAELDDPTSNNALLKMLKHQMETYKRDSDYEGNEDEDENKSDHFKDEIPQNDCIQLSHRPAKELVTTCSIRNKPRSLSRVNTQLRFTVHDITGSDPNNFSNNCTSIVEKINQNQSNEERNDSLKASNFDFSITHNQDKPNMIPSHIVSHVHEGLILAKSKHSNLERKRPRPPPGVFQNMHHSWRKSMTGVTNSHPVIRSRDYLVPLTVSTPYPLHKNMIPSYFIERQAFIQEAMCDLQRKTDIYFHPIGRLEAGRNLLPAIYAHIPNIRKTPLPIRCCEGDDKWLEEHSRCFYKNEPSASCKHDDPKHKIHWKIAGKGSTGKIGINKKEIHKVEAPGLNKKIKKNIIKKSPVKQDDTDGAKKDLVASSSANILKTTSSKGVQCPMHQGVLRGCSSLSQDTNCNLMKNGIPLLGKKRYVQPLLDFIATSHHQ